jgi:hypothetical protein
MNEDRVTQLFSLCMGTAVLALLYAWFIHQQLMLQYEVTDSRLQRLEKEVLGVKPGDT